MSDLITASDQRPLKVHRSVHSRQNASCLSRARSGSIGAGTDPKDAEYDKTKGTTSPLATINSLTVLRFSPLIGTEVRSVTMSGPAMARRVPSSRRVTQGTDRP